MSLKKFQTVTYFVYAPAWKFCKFLLLHQHTHFNTRYTQGYTMQITVSTTKSLAHSFMKIKSSVAIFCFLVLHLNLTFIHVLRKGYIKSQEEHNPCQRQEPGNRQGDIPRYHHQQDGHTGLQARYRRGSSCYRHH